LLRLSPATGRQHQIRVHLSASGYPPAADRHYGRRETLTGQDLNQMLGRRVVPAHQILLARCPLHAWSIEYWPPAAGEPRLQKCPLPTDMSALLELLRSVDPPRGGR
jgi:23S rRNA pseudouridine955/2504/2580 synthase